MFAEMSAGTPKGTARGVRAADWNRAQQPDRRRPRITGKTAVEDQSRISVETSVQGVQDVNLGGLSI